MAKIPQTIDRTLAQLEREGHLSPQQRALTTERLHLALHAGRPDLASVVASLGALLVAAGLLYLIGYNWQQLGKPVQLTVIFVLWAALHAAGWFLAEQPGRSPRLGRAFTLLGVLAFGGAIGLVAQIYNLSAHYPNSILLWWALSVPVVLVTRSRAVLAAVMSIAFVWTLWHLGVWLEDLPYEDVRDWLASYSLVGVSIACILLALAALADGSAYDGLAGVLRSPVAPLVALAPFVLAFHEPWTAPESWTGLDPQLRSEAFAQAARRMAPVGLTLGLAAFLLGLATWRRGPGSARTGWIAFGLTALLALTVLIAPRLVPWIANVLLFGGALALSAYAVQHGRNRLANGAIFLFVAGVVARYFEYLWDKLEGAYAFLATGALLMAAAWFLESRRRAVRAHAQGEPR